MADVRQAIAMNSPLGAFTVRDLERVVEQGSVELNGIAINRQKIDDMVLDMRKTLDVAAALDVPNRLVDLLGKLLLNIEERSGLDFTPDLTNLKRPLERAGSMLGSRALAKPAQGQDPSTLPAVGTASAMAVQAIGFLNSRADVVNAMDAICTYLERHEPTNPVPLLIRRAQRLMDMNFLDIVKDMSPDGLNQVLNLAGPQANGAK
ncbi:MAG: hypothetical protein LBH31_04485 [Burkholderiaceae bacterium]|nr:hypothetical protein [Burkholderiaceae bacterium]